MNPELVLRPATEEDTGAVAEVMLAARAGAVETATMPPPVHPASDMVRHVREDILPHREVWVAEVDGDVVGVMAVDEQWLDDLYVTPDHAGQGVGSALLDLAKALRPDGFELSTSVGKLPGPDANGPSVPVRGGRQDIATLRLGLSRLKGRFKTSEDLCLVPSFGTEVAQAARALSGVYTAPGEPLFETLCFIYPTPGPAGH